MARMVEKSEAVVRAAAEARVLAEYPKQEGHLPEDERQGTVPRIFEESVAEEQKHSPPPASPPSNDNCPSLLIYQISIFLLILLIMMAIFILFNF